MYSKQFFRRNVIKALVLASALTFACYGSVIHHQPQATTHAATVQAVTSLATVPALTDDQFNSQLAHRVWAPLVAAHPAQSHLDANTISRVVRLTKQMSATQRADFIVGVRAAQVKLQTGGFSQIELAKFETVLNNRGYSPSVAKQLSRDPVAMMTIPVRAVDNQSSISSNQPASVMETSFTDAKTGQNYSFSDASTTTCHWSNTRPVLHSTWYALFGDRLATVSYTKDWCWKMTPPLYIPLLWTSTIVYAPHWEPPHTNFTSWCLGCSVTVDWHDQYWYHYYPPNPISGDSHSGFVTKVNYHLHQCIGIGPISQCLANIYRYWSLHLHSDGTFTYQY